MEVTAEAGGKIKLSELFVKHRNIMEAEAIARGIDFEELPNTWDKLSLKDMRDALRTDELKNRTILQLVAADTKVGDMKDIAPVSNEMNALLKELRKTDDE